MRSFRPLALFAAGAWLLSAAPATAHRWYPAWCCNENDCRELDPDKGETVVEAPDGWHLWDGRVFARGSERLSPDGKFHLCEEATTKAIICLFAPPGAS
jgi:hypothetical protein